MILAAICKLLLALGAGCYLSKKGIFNAEVNQKLSSFVMNICMPLVILTSLNETGSDMSRGLMTKYILVGGLIYAALPFVAKGINRLTAVPAEDRPVYELAYIFSNNFFMGYPVAASLYGSACVFQLCVFNLGFDLLYYTYGVGMISIAKQGGRGKVNLKQLLSPGTLASVAALVMFFAGVKMPDAAADVCSYLGNIASPLSMVVIGANIGSYSVKSVLTYDKRIYFFAVIRLIVFPAVSYGLMTLLGFTGMLRGIGVISFGMPAAAMVSMGCLEYQYKEDLASAIVILTTLLALPVIPVLIAALG